MKATYAGTNSILKLRSSARAALPRVLRVSEMFEASINRSNTALTHPRGHLDFRQGAVVEEFLHLEDQRPLERICPVHSSIGDRMNIFISRVTRVGNDVNELGENFWTKRERDLRLKDLALEEFVRRLVRRQLDEAELNQNGGSKSKQ